MKIDTILSAKNKPRYIENGKGLNKRLIQVNFHPFNFPKTGGCIRL